MTSGQPIKIIVIGSCMIDFSFYAPRLPNSGETLHGTKFVLGYGGKGANQCVAAAKLGASTALVARLGCDSFGQDYLKVLKSNNVNTDNVHHTRGVPSGMANITIAESGENSIVIVPAANDHLSKVDVNQSSALMESAAVLVYQLETPTFTTLHALKMKKDGQITILNGAPAMKLDPFFLRVCSIFCVNESEASLMTKIKVASVTDAEKAIAKLLKMGCNTVIITLGKDGAVFATKEDNTVVHVPTTDVTPVDTTGAGDMFIGALAYYLAYFPSLDLKEIIRRSCQIASVSVQSLGTQTSFPERDKLPSDLFEPTIPTV